MNRSNVDVIVKLDRDITPNQLDRVQRLLSNEPGIIRVRMHQKLGHVLLVDYDAFNTNVQAILNRVRQAGSGATLIGM